MKSLKFSRDSWHYRLVNATGYAVYEGDEVDLCGYTWRVIGSMLMMVVLFFLSIAAGMIVIHFLLGIGFSLAYGAWMFNEIGFAGIVITFLVLFFWATAKFSEWKSNRRYREKPQKPDGFIKHAYKSHKEKYCHRVVFDEPK